MSQLLSMKPKTAVEKRTQTVTDTIMITPESVRKWKAPPFQRPLKTNRKVLALAETLKHTEGVIPGVITLGVFDTDTYLLDGQHRVAAFLIADLKEGYTDIRKHYFDSMAEMGDEWVNLNSQLVRMGPDDILRGLEGSSPLLQLIRRRCHFIGYDQIRRGENAPVISMSACLRFWKASAGDVPASSGLGGARDILAGMLEEEAKELCDFLNLAVQAFGRDKEYSRLWGSLNMTLCMWLYRKMVKTQWSPMVPRMDSETFRKCMTSLSASAEYLDWLVGRQLSERDRSPAYSRIRRIFSERVLAETGKRWKMPQPPWAHGI